jgi:hypothetical protein
VTRHKSVVVWPAIENEPISATAFAACSPSWRQRYCERRHGAERGLKRRPHEGHVGLGEGGGGYGELTHCKAHLVELKTWL